MKTVLILAYYCPPLGMGGTQRVAKFAKYLPDFGWQPTVLTVKEIAYYAQDRTLLDEMGETEIHRSGSFDPLRLAFLFRRSDSSGGAVGSSRFRRRLMRILNWLFIPDTKLLWLPFAFVKAVRLLRRNPIDCILTTAPPHSAHLLGILLKWIFRVPWVADFRDGWAGGNFQDEPTRLHKSTTAFLQNCVLRSADRVVGVSAGLAESLHRISGRDNGDFETITNGFDSSDLDQVEPSAPGGRFRMVYCGAITGIAPARNFLQALASLLKRKPGLQERIRVEFVGADLETDTAGIIKDLKLAGNVAFSGYLGHLTALEKVLAADLLLYPVAPCASPDFIPGKTFEYLTTAAPVLVMGHEVEGVTILKKHTAVTVVAHDDIPAITDALEKLVAAGDRLPVHEYLRPAEYERRHLTERLAQLLDRLV